MRVHRSNPVCPPKPVKLEPLGNVLRVVVVIIAVLVVIGILLDIAGMPIGGWRLSAMEPSHELEQPAGRRKGRRLGDRRCRLESKSNRVLADGVTAWRRRRSARPQCANRGHTLGERVKSTLSGSSRRPVVRLQSAAKAAVRRTKKLYRAECALMIQ